MPSHLPALQAQVLVSKSICLIIWAIRKTKEVKHYGFFQPKTSRIPIVVNSLQIAKKADITALFER